MEEEQSQAHHDLMGLGRKVLQKKLKEKKEYSFPDEVDIPAILGQYSLSCSGVGIIALRFELR